MDTNKDISLQLSKHYTKAFNKYGATPKGVDWGERKEDHILRMEKMLALLESNLSELKLDSTVSILDVGCGYGGLRELISEKRMALQYTGIDLSAPMIEAARQKNPKDNWIVGDAVEINESSSFDYVVCNGILTQKLDVSIRDMDEYLKTLIRKMFDICRVGVAFNVMTTYVNYTEQNLYYKSPVELLSWCMAELTSRVKLDHAYPLYEYTLYLYKSPESNSYDRGSKESRRK